MRTSTAWDVYFDQNFQKIEVAHMQHKFRMQLYTAMLTLLSRVAPTYSWLNFLRKLIFQFDHKKMLSSGFEPSIFESVKRYITSDFDALTNSATTAWSKLFTYNNNILNKISILMSLVPVQNKD